MSDIAITAFPNGASVALYPKTNWAAPGPPSGAPTGAATATKEATGGKASFSGVTAGEYWAAAEVNGSYRYVTVIVGQDHADASAEEQVQIDNLGSDWSDGERLFGFSAQNAAPTKAFIGQGYTATPDEGNQPNVAISRVSSVPETVFSGDGAGNLAAFRVHHTALSSAQGQSIAISASAITFGTYEAGHSLSDGIALYALGISKGSSTRTGMGIFANGRRETSTGRATGIEVAVDNEVEGGAQTFTGTLPGTKAIHIHANGLADSAAGIVFAYSGVAAVHTGIGFTASSVTGSAFADYSSAKHSVLVKGSHEEAAFASASGAGPVVVGAEKVSVANALLEAYFGESALTPGVVFGTDKAKNVSSRLIRNSTGELNAFAANTANNFLTTTAQGDTGFSFSPGKALHLGAVGKTSMVRIEEAKFALYGVTPTARAAAIAEPAETLAGLKAAVNSIRTALKNIGITE
jgi:hypothetical protein